MSEPYTKEELDAPPTARIVARLISAHIGMARHPGSRVAAEEVERADVAFGRMLDRLLATARSALSGETEGPRSAGTPPETPTAELREFFGTIADLLLRIAEDGAWSTEEVYAIRAHCIAEQYRGLRVSGEVPAQPPSPVVHPGASSGDGERRYWAGVHDGVAEIASELLLNDATREQGRRLRELLLFGQHYGVRAAPVPPIQEPEQ